MAVDYHLVSASRRAYRVKPEKGVYVFGREDSVDIVLQDALASRRHAELRWMGDHRCWALFDLNSRNGVFVNGQRIAQPCRIDDGTQLQIGGSVFRMYLLPPGGDPASIGQQAPQISTQETMAPGMNMDAMATAGAAFTGQVTGGLLDLLQFFVSTGKSGRLDLIGAGSGISAVWFEQGVPVHAAHLMLGGMDALAALCAKPPPRFAFHTEGGDAPARSLGGSPASILMEAARMVDEQRR